MLFSFLILIITILAIDLYGFYGLKKFLRNGFLLSHKRLILRIYWIMDIGFIVFAVVWALIIRNSSWPDYIQYRNYFYITGAFVFIFLPKFVFLIFNVFHDIAILLSIIKRKITGIRSDFSPFSVAQWILKAGFVLSLFMFTWVLYGVLYGRFNFKVKEVEIAFEHLPSSFDGFRIVHISDTHFGSFARVRPVRRGLQKIKDTPHDMLVFSGDMVNNEAVEAERFIDLFAAIESSYGKFSVLGNHDMGDYRRWYTIEEKAANLEQLKSIQEAMGFILLRNDHQFLTRGNDSIMIAGVDNWGLPPFHQLGDLDEALGENAGFPFVMLISHDPSHWTEQVVPDHDIALTFSGHTHGFQAGFRTPWFQWSPVRFKYETWNGLYEEAGQFLYVNRGFGFIGFPGRMGMRPEITLITLRAKDSSV